MGQEVFQELVEQAIDRLLETYTEAGLGDEVGVRQQVISRNRRGESESLAHGARFLQVLVRNGQLDLALKILEDTPYRLITNPAAASEAEIHLLTIASRVSGRHGELYSTFLKAMEDSVIDRREAAELLPLIGELKSTLESLEQRIQDQIRHED